jgi:hypothetical protein
MWYEKCDILGMMGAWRPGPLVQDARPVADGRDTCTDALDGLDVAEACRGGSADGSFNVNGPAMGCPGWWLYCCCCCCCCCDQEFPRGSSGRAGAAGERRVVEMEDVRALLGVPATPMSSGMGSSPAPDPLRPGPEMRLLLPATSLPPDGYRCDDT